MSDRTGPQVDFPGNLLEFEARFTSEDACRLYLERVRWPSGFICPRCKSSQAWKLDSGLWHCGGCRRQTSVTAGTIFDATRKPLTLWFRVMWFITSRKSGASALDMQQQLGFTRYETVWTWLHKLRRAMVRPDRDLLSGEVEVDETYVGGVENGVHGRETNTKLIVVIAAEKRGEGTGRIRLGHIPDVTAASLLPFVRNSIVKPSIVHTDAWGAYGALSESGYQHEVTNISRTELMAHELLPRVHRVASLLKRWMLGTLQGAVFSKHLQYYLDEFTFRFNRRTSSMRGKLFYRLVQQATAVDPVLNRDVVRGRESNPGSDVAP